MCGDVREKISHMWVGFGCMKEEGKERRKEERKRKEAKGRKKM